MGTVPSDPDNGEHHAPDVDLHDVSRCPLGHRCEACGDERDDLAVTTASTAVGVLCVSLCPTCLASGIAPPVSIGTAARLVGAHCVHLGIDLDHMADRMAQGEAGR
jgi:hypothetical protein